MLLSLAGTNCSTKSVSKERRRKMDMSITVTGAKRDKDKDSGGWHKGGVAGYIAQSMCQERH